MDPPRRMTKERGMRVPATRWSWPRRQADGLGGAASGHGRLDRSRRSSRWPGPGRVSVRAFLEKLAVGRASSDHPDASQAAAAAFWQRFPWSRAFSGRQQLFAAA
ncbi:hypothetical protein ACRAWD_24200 [Caulobacter segnis]